MVSEQARPDLRLTDLDMFGRIPGPEEFSWWNKEKMETGWNHPVMEAAVLSWLDHHWETGNFRWCFQTWIPNRWTPELTWGTGDELNTSSLTRLCPRLPLSLYYSLQNAPFTLQSSNLERFHILCWKGKGPSRPFSEVSCCYGCICLLNIMMVLWGVMPLWLSFLKTKAQF